MKNIFRGCGCKCKRLQAEIKAEVTYAYLSDFCKIVLFDAYNNFYRRISTDFRFLTYIGVKYQK
jgi:hypothetical protein